MKISPIGLDFESLPIHEHPDHRLPQPVSFSLQLPGQRKPQFISWAHKTGGNNSNFETAKTALKAAYKVASPTNPICCFNSAFDLNVAAKWFGLALPSWECFEDPMFLLFLDDPHQRQLDLKSSADRLLGMPPEERDAVVEWLMEHKAQLETEFPDIPNFYCRKVDKGVSKPGGITKGNASALIAFAPGNVVEPYANGDVVRMLRLWKILRQNIQDRGMMEAYDRERRIMPILSRNSAEGLRIDRAKLEQDLEIYQKAQEKADVWLRKALKAPGLDFNKDGQVADALDNAGQVEEWTLTATGKRSVSKKNMKIDQFKDPKVAAAYGYRQKCATFLETFIRPWLYYSAFDGWMRTTWNQVRNSSQGDTGGTRTGRPSSRDPNFFNMPKPVEDNADKGFMHPKHLGVPDLPFVRSYILPDEKGHVVVRRDFNQQELRIVGHFEDGQLMEDYLSNPAMDVHEYVRVQILELLGLDLGRPITKQLNFGYIYGMGLGALALKLARDMSEVKGLRNAQMKAVPGLKDLDDAIKGRSRQGLPIRTWGGREYYAEEPRFSEKFGRVMDFAYKLLNYLVQGSAADITKESIIRYDAMRRDGRFMLSVYDENVISVPKKLAAKEALILRDAMMSIELDVPLLSDGEWGPNYGMLEDMVEPEADLSRWRIPKGWSQRVTDV